MKFLPALILFLSSAITANGADLIDSWPSQYKPAQISRTEIPKVDQLAVFCSVSCEHCREMAPIIDQMISDGYRIVKVSCDSDEGMEVAKRYCISRIPSFMGFGQTEVISGVGVIGSPRLVQSTGIKTRQEILDLCGWEEKYRLITPSEIVSNPTAPTQPVKVGSPVVRMPNGDFVEVPQSYVDSVHVVNPPRVQYASPPVTYASYSYPTQQPYTPSYVQSYPQPQASYSPVYASSYSPFGSPSYGTYGGGSSCSGGSCASGGCQGGSCMSGSCSGGACGLGGCSSGGCSSCGAGGCSSCGGGSRGIFGGLFRGGR